MREFGAVCSLPPAERADFLSDRSIDLYESRVFATGGCFRGSVLHRIPAKRFYLACGGGSLAGSHSLAAAIGRLQEALWLNVQVQHNYIVGRNSIVGIIGAIVGFLTGIAVAYWLVEKRLHKQKQEHLLQTRRIAQDIELAQISRLQQSAESEHGERENQLRKATVEHENLLRQVTTQYENQLKQVTNQYENRLQQVLAERDRLQQVAGAHEQQIRQVSQELEAAHNARQQENLQSLQAEHEHHLLTVSDELHHNYQAQMDEHLQNLQKQHEIQLRQTASQYGNSEVEMQLTREALQQQYDSQLQAAYAQFQAHEAQMQATIRSLQEQYQSNVQQEVPDQQFSQLNPTEFTSDLPQQEVWQEPSSELNQPEVEQELNYTAFPEP